MTYIAHAIHHTLEFQGVERWHDLPTAPGPGGGSFGHLLATGPDHVSWLRTDVTSGPVTIDLTFTETEPPPPPLADCEIVVAASALTRGGPLGLRGAEDMTTLVEEHSVLVPAGTVRLRVCARRRGIAFDEAVSTPVEHYTVQVWPEAPSPTVSLTSRERVEPHSPVPIPPSGVWVAPEFIPDT